MEPEADNPNRVAIRLLQGYLWHPVELSIDFADWLSSELPGDVHVLWDPLERAPFAFFEDGTPSSSQIVYQFTVLARTWAGQEDELASVLPWVAEQLQEQLERTPAGVGWSLSEDMRPLL